MSSLPLLVSLPEAEESLEILAAELDFSDEERAIAEQMLETRLPPLVKPSCLPYMFGVSHQLIGLIEKRPHLFYRGFVVKKSSGGVREIVAPRRVLKTIQRWIYEHILSKAPLSECATGFVRGRSIFSIGKVHARNKNLMVIDIADFFPSIKFDKVEAIFRDLDFPNRVAHQLSALCCLHESLPQGAPTSPALANLVFRPVDEELSKLSKGWRCDYARYADDLAFSGDRVFTDADRLEAGGILERFGFSVHERKSRIVGQGGRQVIAGLVVNNNVLPPRVKRRRWRATFHRASRYPEEFEDRVQRLFGIASFVNQYSQETASRYREIAKRVLLSSR